MEPKKDSPMKTTLLGLLTVIIIPILWLVIPYFLSLGENQNQTPTSIQETKKPGNKPGSNQLKNN